MSGRKGTESAFERIRAGMDGAIAFAQGDHTRGRVVRGTWPPTAGNMALAADVEQPPQTEKED
jgi:hypothetical protein